MTLSEVNFYVIKAILSLPQLQTESTKIFSAFEELMKYFGPVVKNYIKGETAMSHCLKAFEVSFSFYFINQFQDVFNLHLNILTTFE